MNSIARKTGILGLCLALLAPAAQSQVALGLKGGLNVSNLNGLDADNYQTKALVGVHGGVYAAINLGRNFALQPELAYSTQGAKLEGATDTDYKINYMNIPVMVRFLTDAGLFLEAGPQIGFQVGDVSVDNFDQDIKKSDFAVGAGLGFMGKSQGFGIGARYNVGISKLEDVNSSSFSNADYKNGVLQISLYLRLLGGGKLKDNDN